MSGGAGAYPYGGRDLLREPERYRYSPFQGEPFLAAYAQARTQTAARFETHYLARLRAEGGAAPWLQACTPWLDREPELFSPAARAVHRALLAAGAAEPLAHEWKRALAALSGAAELSTAPTLALLLSTLVRADGPAAETAAAWLRRFLRRFEVARRLAAAYSPELRPLGREWSDPLPYALLAAGAVVSARRSGDLVSLNAALKLGDLLSATSPQAHTIPGLFYTVAALRGELAGVRRLAAIRGVKL